MAEGVSSWRTDKKQAPVFRLKATEAKQLHLKFALDSEALSLTTGAIFLSAVHEDASMQADQSDDDEPTDDAGAGARDPRDSAASHHHRTS